MRSGAVSPALWGIDNKRAFSLGEADELFPAMRGIEN